MKRLLPFYPSEWIGSWELKSLHLIHYREFLRDLFCRTQKSMKKETDWRKSWSRWFFFNFKKVKLFEEENLYKILEVPRFATTEEIKRQYRHLVKIHHPDRGGDEELFLKINEAYKILNDPEKRREYNMKKRGKEEKRIFVDSKSKEELTNRDVNSLAIFALSEKRREAKRNFRFRLGFLKVFRFRFAFAFDFLKVSLSLRFRSA